MKLLASVSLLSAMALRALAQSADVGPAINQLGLDVLRAEAAPDSPRNLLLSPYAVESALVMAWTGAAGRTQEEMRHVLHLEGDDAAVVNGFSALARRLGGLPTDARPRAETDGREGAPQTPVELDIANRLFVQSGFAPQPDFTRGLREQFGSPLEPLDFLHAAEPARLSINAWVAQETHDRICELIPSGALNARTRLVLANAVYLRASWMSPFEPEMNSSRPFWADGRTQAKVPTMMQRKHFRYEKRDGYAAVALPYAGGELQFLILLPDQRDGLAALVHSVTPAVLAASAKMPRADVLLFLPKFRLAPPGMSLGPVLRGLGMTTAFDSPPGSADFARIAPRTADDYLALSDVFHQAWLSVDEAGTEAAAADAVTLMTFGVSVGAKPVPPVEVDVDHPFLFAIQDAASGACLFLGQVEDPR